MAAPAPGGVPVMIGGAREQTFDLLQKYAAPLNMYVGFLLVLGIVYVGKLPDSVTWQANQMLGRILLLVFTLGIATLYSWTYALLMGTFAVLLLSMSPRTPVEGFQSEKDGDVDVKLVTQKRKWWVEEVLGENPIGIEEEKVRTSAIQDSGSGSNSLTSSKSS